MERAAYAVVRPRQQQWHRFGRTGRFVLSRTNPPIRTHVRVLVDSGVIADLNTRADDPWPRVTFAPMTTLLPDVHVLTESKSNLPSASRLEDSTTPTDLRRISQQ